jgi:hypothetical protein
MVLLLIIRIFLGNLESSKGPAIANLLFGERQDLDLIPYVLTFERMIF